MSKNWARANDNSIILKVTASSRADYRGLSDVKYLWLHKSPNKPNIKLVNSNQLFTATSLKTICETQSLNFYANGATSYQVSIRSIESNDMWVTTILGDVTKYTYKNFKPNIVYDFMVEAVNGYGIISSEIVSRNKCALDIDIYPNPSVNSIKVRAGDNNNTVIESIDITKITNPNIKLIKDNTLEEKEVEIDMNNLPTGVYNINIKDKDGIEENKTFVKF